MDEMSRYYDRNREAAPKYQEGDRVWLSTQNYTTDRCNGSITLDSRLRSGGGVGISQLCQTEVWVLVEYGANVYLVDSVCLLSAVQLSGSS